jgi:hypothetical protein
MAKEPMANWATHPCGQSGFVGHCHLRCQCLKPPFFALELSTDKIKVGEIVSIGI